VKGGTSMIVQHRLKIVVIGASETPIERFSKEQAGSTVETATIIVGTVLRLSHFSGLCPKKSIFLTY
jgi:hypothetical protein